MSPNRKKFHKQHRSDRYADQLVRLRKVLTIALQANCTKYSWFSLVSGYVRSQRFDLLYQWSDRASTVVYSTAAEHFAANQIVALVKKVPLTQNEFRFERSALETAIQKFNEAEEACRNTNVRFTGTNWLSSPFRAQLEYARRWIHGVLGQKPDLPRIYRSCDFSSGAAIGVHGNATNLFRKFFAKEWSVTPCAIPYVFPALCSNEQFFTLLTRDEESPYSCYDVSRAQARFEARLRIISCNKVEFVPKTAKTDRSIAVEPLLNSFIQKGIDAEMRRLLLARGYDLSDQTRNGFLAKVGSLNGEYATLDLSSASDTVSTELVRYLLPDAWFDLLNRTRSPSYSLSGKIEKYAKFASMGNGFCFPLETLIFASAVRASLFFAQCDRRHAVYGDDIIVSVDAFECLSGLLSEMGFKLNSEKSFASGPFRESCGADWYEGQDVRPVYLDYLLDNTSSLMIFHNATQRSQRAADFFAEVRSYLRSLCPPHELLLRPFAYRTVTDRHKVDRIMLQNLNGAFDVPLDEFMGSRSATWNSDEQRWSWREFHYSAVTDKSSDPNFHEAQYLAFLRGSPSGELYLRRKTTRRAIRR